MVYSYTPTYYTSLHDSITSLCKNILPFSFKKRRLTAIAAAEQRLSELQSDNLKWQQESFHQILNLMGLCKEGILPETEVSAFRSHLLDTLIASPMDHEQPLILRDKLIFLQELLYAKCISEDEYHSSKRPLLQRLAIQGAEIEAKDLIISPSKQPLEEEWSVIDLKEEKCLLANKPKSILGFNSSQKNKALFGSSKQEKGVENKAVFGQTRSILMAEMTPLEIGEEKLKKNLFKIAKNGSSREEKGSKKGKKILGFEGFKKWIKSDSEDETAPLSLFERSDHENYQGQLVENPIGEGPDTKQIKRKLHSNGAPSDFFVDKILGENIKKELSRIQTELSTTNRGTANQGVQFSNEQIEAISTRLPVDKADLKKFFPESWCDQYGDVVLGVVKKEFKGHVGEMANSRNAFAIEEKKHASSEKWTTFDDEEDDDENIHPNLFNHSYTMKQPKFDSSKDVLRSSNGEKCFKYNPFFDD